MESGMSRRGASWGCLMGVLLAAAGCSKEPTAPVQRDATPMLVVPNMSVGPIHAGMTVAGLYKVLGEPQKKTATALDYPHLGLAVMPNKEGIVVYVMGGDITGLGGPYVKQFNGRTKEGLGMFSTRAEILKTFGQPTETKGQPGGLESLKYERQGMTFSLQGDKVYHMIVTLRGEEPPPEPDSPDVKLDIVPPGEQESKR